MLSVAINGARVYDPRAKRFSAGSIGILNGRIAALSSDPLDAETMIDAGGRIACPGFIDVHTHIDWARPMQDLSRCACQSLRQGVTTAISGNCGSSVQRMSDFTAMMKDGFPVHHGELIGHSTLRRTIGLTDLLTPATQAQLHRMLPMAQAALEEGAYGVSFGLGYIPGTGDHEVIALARLAARYGKLIAVDTKMDTPEDLTNLAFVLRVAQETGVRLQVSHFVYQYGEGVIEQAVELMNEARARGVDAWADSGMYVHWATGMGAWMFCEPFIEANPGMLNLLVVSTGEHTGSRLDMDLYHHMRQQHPGDSVVVMTGLEHSIYESLKAPYAMPSSDTAPYAPGQGHPQVAGSFARYLRKVRETGFLPWEEALYRATLLPAQTFGLAGKGRMEIGMDADIAVFDPDTVADCSRFCHEGSPDAPPVGIQCVLVAGKVACLEGDVRSQSAGRVLLTPAHMSAIAGA